MVTWKWRWSSQLSSNQEVADMNSCIAILSAFKGNGYAGRPPDRWVRVIDAGLEDTFNTRLIKEKIDKLEMEEGEQQILWNNSVQKKVNIFI
jgi:hypothetical protein